MQRAFSHALTTVVATGLLPPALIRACINREWRESLPERFGAGCWHGLGSRVQDCAWFHGASVGEVNGIEPVARALRERRLDLDLFVSTTSLTGRSEVQHKGFATASCLLPYDHPLFISTAIRELRPRIFVATETELWPNLFFALERRGIPMLLINGRISDYTFPRYRRLKRIFGPTLSGFRRIMTQTELDAERFVALGAPAELVEVSGSTKFDQLSDRVEPAELDTLARRFGIARDRLCFVAGSVRPEEDEAVLSAYRFAAEAMPELQLIIAPRHPDRFEAVAGLLERAGLEFNRRSLGDAKEQKPVLLLDTLGELRMSYALGDIAFVGGSLVDIGGHNPFEPAAFRKPVIVGPYTSTVRDAVRSLRQERAIFEVKDERELAETLLSLLEHPAVRERAGEAAYHAWQKNLGATERVLSVLEECLAAK